MEILMKKNCLFVTLFMTICCLLVFAGCSAKATVKSICVVSDNETTIIELGKFNYDDYKIKVNYSNGESKEIVISEDMISMYDKLKFYQVGDQTITINYSNCSCDMKITVKRASLDDVVFEDKTVVYTGNPFVMEVSGDIPSDVVVRYPNGNTFSNAGNYEITAICYGDNYETKELYATLTIKKATYDLSDIKFENKTFVYDKSPKSLAITGTLPEGVSVEYRIGDKKGNSEINAGEYTVVASFISKNANYESIPDKTAVLKINKAKYADIKVSLKDKNVVYSGHSNSIETDLSAVPSGVSTYYTIQKIKNAKGESVVSAEVDGNSTIVAGTYIVRLYFKVSDTLNFENIAPISAILFVDRAVYELKNVFMYSNSFVYDGTEKTISLSGEINGQQPALPFGIDVDYSYKQIKDEKGNEIDGISQNGNSVINAGTYEISAHLTSSDENYKEISDIIGILEIRQAEYENLIISMSDLTVRYDGNAHSITVVASNLPDTVSINYTIKMTQKSTGEDIENPVAKNGNSATEVGTYEIVATFVNSNKNYAEITSISAILVVLEVE